MMGGLGEADRERQFSSISSSPTSVAANAKKNLFVPSSKDKKQQDVVSYINDAVKTKNELSTFCKNNIGEDGKGTLYWLDGNEIICLRLYKEVKTFLKKGSLRTINCCACSLTLWYSNFKIKSSFRS